MSNIVTAQRWLTMIIEGKTFAEIAETERVTNRRVKDLMSLAMLAPDVLDSIASGEQSCGLTNRYLIRTDYPHSGQIRLPSLPRFEAKNAC